MTPSQSAESGGVIRYETEGFEGMTPFEGGEWIKFTDYEILCAELAAARERQAKLVELLREWVERLDMDADDNASAYHAARRLEATVAAILATSPNPTANHQ